MDSTPLHRVSQPMDQLTQLSKVNPTARGVGESLQHENVTTQKANSTFAPVKLLEEQLFSLEQHVPLQILKNPQLMKAEWAWKLLVLQNLTLGEQHPQVVQSNLVESRIPQNDLFTQEEQLQTTSDLATTTTAQGDTGSLANASRQVPNTSTVRSLETPGHLPLPNPSGESTKFSQPYIDQSGRTSPLGQGGAESQPIPETPQSVSIIAELAVRQLWSLLTTSTSLQGKGSPQIMMNLKTDPPIIPFASMNHDTIALAKNRTDRIQLQQWVVQDRLLAGVLDNPYERMGSGLFYLPSQNDGEAPPHRAVKWEAHRQTRIGTGGKLVHRIRLNLDVQGQALTCIVTAQRPQLFVHFLSDDRKLLHHLRQGEPLLVSPLSACGWDLLGWTAGLATENEGQDGQS